MECWTKLYLIEFLHQTTTLMQEQSKTITLYLIEFLHQTTTTGCVRIDFMAFMPGFPTEKNGFELRGSRFDVFFSYFKEQI